MNTSAKNLLYTLLLGILSISQGCQQSRNLSPGEGFIETENGKIWYQISGEGKGAPLLLLHGGPGFSSHYLKPMAALGADRPIIFVDQLGSGRSEQIHDTTLMTIDQFVEQIELVKSALGLEEFFLYGHSWGTMLAMDYYTKYPEGIKGIVFASPLFSTAMWTKDADLLIKNLPHSTQQAIAIHTENNTFDSPEYQTAMDVYYKRYAARKTPWDDNLNSTFAAANFAIYTYMWGPSEFTSTGTLKNYDRLEEAKSVIVPSLFVCGEYDEAQPSTVDFYSNLVPNSKFEIIENSAHILTHDNPKMHNQIVRDFIDKHDK